MEGRDKRLYMVTLKNGVKQWSVVGESVALAILKKDIPLLTEKDVIHKAQPNAAPEDAKKEKPKDVEPEDAKPEGESPKKAPAAKKPRATKAKKVAEPAAAEPAAPAPAPEKKERKKPGPKPKAKAAADPPATETVVPAPEPEKTTEKTEPVPAKKPAGKRAAKAPKEVNDRNAKRKELIASLKLKHPDLPVSEIILMATRELDAAP